MSLKKGDLVYNTRINEYQIVVEKAETWPEAYQLVSCYGARCRATIRQNLQRVMMTFGGPGVLSG